MALSDYAFALSALLGTILIPFIVYYQVLRFKRRALKLAARPVPRDGQR